MKQINEPGEYRVTIRNAYWTNTKDERGLTANLPGYVSINGEEHSIIGRLSLTDTYVQRGKNAGKTLTDVNNEMLISLGMNKTANGYIDPAKLTEELEGKEAYFVVEWENDQNDKPQLRVKYINATGRPSLDPNEAKSIFATLISSNGAVKPALPAPPTAAKAVEDIDQIPF